MFCCWKPNTSWRLVFDETCVELSEGQHRKVSEPPGSLPEKKRNRGRRIEDKEKKHLKASANQEEEQWLDFFALVY